MSGGSYNYSYARIEDTYCGRMYDAELDAMMTDLVDVLHDLEWWQSGDYGEESYRKSAKKFKDKWFNRSRKDRLTEIVEQKCDALKEELLKII